MNDRPPIRDRALVLRVLVPGLEARLRDKMKEMEDLAASMTAGGPSSPKAVGGSGAAKDLYLDLEGVVCEPTTAKNGTLWKFHCDGASYLAKLVNLPCPVELHKTHDHAVYCKSADVAQMLIVYEDDMALEEAEEKSPEGFNYHHSGLTPPTRQILERRFAAREQKAVPPPRTASAEVETELMELMEKLAKDDKGKRNKVPTLTSANKVLEEVVEEVVEYEPWMSDFGRQPHGIEFDADDQLASKHPEVWLSASEIRELKEAEEEERKKKEEASLKKEGRRKEKKNQSESTSTKKGIPSKKNLEPVDDITQAAASMLTGGDGDLDFMDGDALFDDLDLDADGLDFGDL